MTPTEFKKRITNLDGDLGLVGLAAAPQDEGKDGEEENETQDEPGYVVTGREAAVTFVVVRVGAGGSGLAIGGGVVVVAALVELAPGGGRLILERGREAGGGGLPGVVERGAGVQAGVLVVVGRVEWGSARGGAAE